MYSVLPKMKMMLSAWACLWHCMDYICSVHLLQWQYKLQMKSKVLNLHHLKGRGPYTLEQREHSVNGKWKQSTLHKDCLPKSWQPQWLGNCVCKITGFISWWGIVMLPQCKIFNQNCFSILHCISSGVSSKRKEYKLFLDACEMAKM